MGGRGQELGRKEREPLYKITYEKRGRSGERRGRGKTKEKRRRREAQGANKGKGVQVD